MIRRRLHMLVGPTLALLAGCADLLDVQPLSGVLEGGVDGKVIADAAPSDGGCQIAWVDASGGAVPNGAVPNSDVDSSVVVYVCRVDAPALGVVPGKLLPGWACFYGNGQVELLSQDYQVLVPEDCSMAWVPAVANVAPPNSLVCGEDLEGGVLYSCRAGDTAEHAGELGHMGWSTGHDCLYSYSGASFSTADFDLLTAP